MRWKFFRLIFLIILIHTAKKNGKKVENWPSDRNCVKSLDISLVANTKKKINCEKSSENEGKIRRRKLFLFLHFNTQSKLCIYDKNLEMLGSFTHSILYIFFFKILLSCFLVRKRKMSVGCEWKLTFFFERENWKKNSNFPPPSTDHHTFLSLSLFAHTFFSLYFFFSSQK
jgi:hypothetical protein